MVAEVKKGDEMKTYDIDQIDVDKLPDREIRALPEHVIKALDEKWEASQLEEIRSRIDYLPRNWNSNIDQKDMWTTGIINPGSYHTPHLIIRMNDGVVGIFGWSCGSEVAFEIFKTAEKLDSFIEALTHARDAIFTG